MLHGVALLVLIINMVKSKSAFVMMGTVIAVAVVVAVLVISQATMSTNDAWSDRAWRSSIVAQALAQSCVELTYRSLLLNPDYSGQSLSVAENLCIIEVLKQVGDSYQVTVTARVGEYYKKIQAGVSVISGVLTVNAWQEAE